MNKSTIVSLIETCDENIRQGNTNSVVSKLGGLNIAKVHRVHRLALARIARRVRLTSLALKILDPVINPEKNFNREAAHPEEIAEYGILLFLVGSVHEGLRILESVRSLGSAEALLYTAFAHMSQWNHREAQSHLESYLTLPNLTDYQKAVARLNLASQQILEGSTEEVQLELIELKTLFKKNSYTRLYSNTLELLSQIAIVEKNFGQALSYLKEARDQLAQDQTIDQLFIDKWQSVIHAFQRVDPTPLSEFKSRAHMRKHWESVREADYYTFQITQDEKIFNHLYFGTPFQSYRSRLEKLSNQSIPTIIKIGERGQPLLNVQLGTFKGTHLVTPGKKVHQILACLFNDFYRPQQIGALFSRLFPEEKFLIHSSPFRVHQLIFRLRSELKEKDVPLEITESDGLYHFKVLPGLQLLIERGHGPSDVAHLFLNRVVDIFKNKNFSATEVQTTLNLSSSTCNRLLRAAVGEGKLVKIGAGPSTRYRRNAA